MRAKSAAEVFRYRGSKMVGVWTHPLAAAAPLRNSPRLARAGFPSVLFLHGFPGSEKNVDIQRVLLARGIASFGLHFQGAWGSEGVYRFSSLIDEARAGWRFMRRLEGVDPERTAVLGFSMGGWTALHLAAAEKDCRAVAAIAPVGGPEMVQPGAYKRIAWLSRPLKAPRPAVLFRDFVASVHRWDPAASVPRLGCPLLLVHGGADEIVPLGVSKRLFAAAREPKRLVVVPGASHDFLEQRGRLVRLVTDWLEDALLSPKEEAAAAERP